MSKQSPISLEMALTLTRDLWQWLADNPGRRKDEWPGWARGEQAQAFCFCCQYINDHSVGCDQCPLVGYAWHIPSEDDSDDEDCEPCLYGNSPYAHWVERDHESVYALAIVAACEKRLKEIAKQEYEERET